MYSCCLFSLLNVFPARPPEHPLQLEFDELWRCSAAKAQLEAACAAARAEQHRRLVTMLRCAPPENAPARA